MAHLTLAGRSDDGERLLLVDDRGVEHTLTVDATLRAALRGEHARIGQLEIQMDSALRPRDIQARIRAGETPEAVAQAAQTTVDRVMPFASPVLAERAHVAQRAQRSSVRRRSGESGARTLGEAVAAHLREANVDPDSVEWDAWRREDGRWTLTGQFRAPGRSGTAGFTYDMRGNFVTMDDDDARWLVGEAPTQRTAERGARPSESQSGSRGRRLTAVPADELPLGEDAISLVSDDADEAPVAVPDPAAPTGDEVVDAGATTAEQPAVDAPLAEPLVEPEARQDDAAHPDDERDGDRDDEATSAQADESAPQAEPEPPARKPARKSRGRASVPSWDEIMFGGGSSE
jgi:hypothetical protein